MSRRERIALLERNEAGAATLRASSENCRNNSECSERRTSSPAGRFLPPLTRGDAMPSPRGGRRREPGLRHEDDGQPSGAPRTADDTEAAGDPADEEAWLETRRQQRRLRLQQRPRLDPNGKPPRGAGTDNDPIEELRQVIPDRDRTRVDSLLGSGEISDGR